jgi:L-methionine (R)-S-oxide reductase
MNDLTRQVEALFQQDPDRKNAMQQSLQLVLTQFQSETGTIHRLDAAAQQLHLAAQVGLPPALLEVVKLIPVGKGIAGQTVARGGPVTICNIQKDESGVTRPGARQTGVGGALCVPLRHGPAIVGTLGIGTAREHEYTSAETQALEEVANVMAMHLAGK